MSASAVNFKRVATTTKPLDTKPVLQIGAPLVTERGPIGIKQTITSLPQFQRIYGRPSANAPDAYLHMKALFEEAGKAGAIVSCSRVVHCTDATDPTTKTSAAAALTLETDAVASTAGYFLAAAGPYSFVNGDTLKFTIDAPSSLQTFTLAFAAASRTSTTGPYVLVDAYTLTMRIDGVSTVLTKVFHTSEFSSIGTATAAEVVAALNAFFASQDWATYGAIGAVASVSSNAVKITSLKLGTGSGVNITGGTANAVLSFTTGNIAGTGDAVDSTHMTSAELVTKLSGLTGGTASSVSGALKVTSSTSGDTSSVQLDSSSSTTTKLGGDNAIHAGHDGGAQDTIQIVGLYDGIYANAYSVEILAATNGIASQFNLLLLQNGIRVEGWTNLSMDSTAANYFVDVINGTSTTSKQAPSLLVKAIDLASTLASPDNLPVAGTFGPLTGGSDGLASLADADYIGGVSSNGRTGMRVLDTVRQLALLIVPGRATASVHNAQISYCESTRAGLCFTILDTPAGFTADAMITYVAETALLQQVSELCSIYWPRVLVDNPATDVYGSSPTVAVGPAGAIAGLCARLDGAKPGGAFTQVASEEKGNFTTVRGLEVEAGHEDSEVQDFAVRSRVFDALINPINIGTSVYVDGARTLKDNGPFPTIGESRGVVFVCLTIGAALDPKRNQNIDERLLNEEAELVRPFLKALTKAGCFRSNDDDKAWSFDNSPALNTAADNKARQVNARIGLLTSSAAEQINIEIAPLAAA